MFVGPLWGWENDIGEWPPWKEKEHQNQKHRRNRHPLGKVFFTTNRQGLGILKVTV